MKNLDEALDWLYSNKSKVKDIQLKRISFILNELDLYPKYKTVVVAGTNGKGSTVALLERILMNKGYLVGSFTSPFVIEFNERIKIASKNISDSKALEYLNYLYDYQKEYQKRFNDTIPFFELCLIMALLYFKDNRVDVGIFECGIGGRYDATNVINADVSIITSIGYDHLDRLGSSLNEILYHKIGIARRNKPLVLALDGFNDILEAYKNDGYIIDNIYNDVANISVNSMTCFSYKGKRYRTNLLGSFQAYNMALAIRAASYLDKDISYKEANTLYASMPGRLDILSLRPLIIADGAHNISAIEALMENALAFNRRLIILYASLADKEYGKILKYLNSYATSFIFTYLPDKRAVEPNELIKYIDKPYKIEGLSNIIENIRINADEALLVTGSLHFISYFLNMYKELKKN